MGQDEAQVEQYTTEQAAALDGLVKAFGIIHSKRFLIELKVYNGAWTEASVNPICRLRKAEYHDGSRTAS